MALRASNWSRSALPSAHHEPFGSYEEPTRAYPRSSSACLVDASGASAACGGPKPWLYSSSVPFHGDGTSATQLPPSEVVPERLADVAAGAAGAAASPATSTIDASKGAKRVLRASHMDVSSGRENPGASTVPTARQRSALQT